MNNFLIATFLVFSVNIIIASDTDNLDITDTSDIDAFILDDPAEIDSEIEGIEQSGEVKELKEDMVNTPVKTSKKEKKKKVKKEKIVKKTKPKKKSIVIFDVGNEEKKLLEVSKYIEGKISNTEWDDIAIATKVDKYEVQKGDWLWKISQRLFGTGFYYSKIWSLNPHILNPHKIEPGMVLVLTTGDETDIPQVTLGSFSKDQKDGVEDKVDKEDYLVQYGGDNIPSWLVERDKLIKEGNYFQYSSDMTYDDLHKLGKHSLNNEYKKYEPPVPNILIEKKSDEFDAQGFDKGSVIKYSFKRKFPITTFVTSNIMQDLGEIVDARHGGTYLYLGNKVYVKFDNHVDIRPGDLYSVYSPHGLVQNKKSDRKGYSYTIVGTVKLLRKVERKWEGEVVETFFPFKRHARLTSYTPRIKDLDKVYVKRSIEGIVMKGFDSSTYLSLGSIGYLDRGRADGLEVGAVLNVYSFKDQATQKKISENPAYSIGELMVITLTDNFSTFVVTNSSREIPIGSFVQTKTYDDYKLSMKLKNKEPLKDVKSLERKAKENLDIELNLDDINNDLLNKAHKVKLTAQELEELERQERDYSVIKDHQRDIKELERLEAEIAKSEAVLGEAKVDEDKFLEQQSLDILEKTIKGQKPDSFGQLDEIEKEIGLKYIDQQLDSTENPYGLTKFDLEEIDHLLNSN